MLRLLLVSFIGVALAACVPTGEIRTPAEAVARARELVATSLIVDGHIDVPYRLKREWVDVSFATEDGDFDYPRALSGGLNAPFMSIYVPAQYDGEEAATRAHELIALIHRIVDESPDKFAIPFSVADVRRHFAEGLVSLPMGLENGSAIGNDLAMVRHFHGLGIRYITLTHSKSNQICDSSYDEDRRWDGLSDFGYEVVAEMNRVGIMIDISHVSDAAFWDVLEVTKAPVIASHSSARHFTPGWERNIDDEMIGRVADNGGVVMINFGSAFIAEDANLYSRARSEAFEAYIAERGLEESDDLEESFNENYDRDHGPYPYATLEQTLDHFDYVVALAGVDHVGVGSDFDGVGDSLPVGLKDVSAYPNLVRGLLERGYGEGDIRKMLGENLLRVWAHVEAHARSHED